MIDVNEFTFRKNSAGWYVSCNNIYYLRGKKDPKRTSEREKELFWLVPASTADKFTYDRVVSLFEVRLKTGQVKNTHGVLRWSEKKGYYIEYDPSFDKSRIPTKSIELEKLDNYVEKVKEEKRVNGIDYDKMKRELEAKKAQELEKERQANEPIFKKLETKNVIFGSTIADPLSVSIMSLIGKEVEASNSFCFNESALGILKDSVKNDDKPFKVLINGQLVSCSFVRTHEKRTTPYSLALDEVRRKLMLKPYKSKDGKIESIVTTFVYDNTQGWKVNGMSARQFLDGFVWLDGKPCGEE